MKTNETVLLMHPATDDIGEKLMSVRRGRFPDYDWSELERVVDEQITKEEASVYITQYGLEMKVERGLRNSVHILQRILGAISGL